jgi:hypothetical protein
LKAPPPRRRNALRSSEETEGPPIGRARSDEARSSEAANSGEARSRERGRHRPPERRVPGFKVHLLEVAFSGNRKEFFVWDGEEPPAPRTPVVVEG